MQKKKGGAGPVSLPQATPTKEDSMQIKNMSDEV